MTLLDRLRYFSANRIRESDQPNETAVEIVLTFRPVFSGMTRLRDTEHPQSVAGHRVYLRADARQRGGVHVAEINNGFGRSFRSHHVARGVDGRPHMRHRF